MPKRAVPLALLFWTAPAVAWSQAPLGPEFLVNTYTTQFQGRPAVASDGTGFVAVWDGFGPGGDSAGIFSQRYDGAGAPQGGQFRASAYTTVSYGTPAIAAHADGFVVVYQKSPYVGADFGAFARRFGADGLPQGGEFRVHSYATGDQGQPSVASDAGGSFVVVWMSRGQDGSGDGVFGQRFAASGVAQGGEFRANAFTAGTQAQPAVAVAAGGGFVVVWHSDAQDGSGYGVFGQRYDASGVAQGGEFQVNAYTTSSQAEPAVASFPDGRFVVVWQSAGQDGSNEGVFGQRYDASGSPDGGEFPVNTYTTGIQRLPAIAVDAGGHFVVTWQSYSYGTQDGSNFGVFGQLHDASGAPRGGEFRVNTYTTGVQQLASVASDPEGTFLVAWQSDGQDGSNRAVIGRRFNTDIFADGFESGDLSAWSASATSSGLLHAHSGAAMNSTTFGLLGVVESTAGLYVQDDTPHREDRYRARFYFDPNGFDPGEAQNRRRVRLFIAFEEEPVLRLVAIVLRRLDGAYNVRARIRLDDGSRHDTAFVPIADGPHVLELDWRRSSGPDVPDGSFEMWIDGASVYAASTLDNSASAVDFVRLGALSVKQGANGTLYWDEFRSRRSTYIGP